jgi:hypothetical protein
MSVGCAMAYRESKLRLRAFAIEPNQSLASIVRMALLEWLSDRERAKSEKLSENDKNDISINEND